VLESQLTEYAKTLGGVLQAIGEKGSKAQRDGEEKYPNEGCGFLTLRLNMLGLFL
jgi:hypothetical protein